ncbi:MAG: SecY-interacting protein Syd [Pseudomonadales bacterium]|nr:SecY-interacting protein Syd [Pseudomonadales bacterium]
MHQVQLALNNLINRTIAILPGNRFSTEYDAEWRSDCELETAGEVSFWRPCQQTTPVDFSGLANAVGAPVHPDIQAFYASFWSGGLTTESAEGPVNLIQLWNPEDFDRLIENLIGHFLVQKRANLPFTVFFATTDEDSELFLSIDNQSGKILLDEPAKAPVREIDTDLSSFLNRLGPRLFKPEP